MDATKMSFSGWLGRSAVVHADRGVLFSAKKKCAVEPWEDAEKTKMHITECKKPV